MNSKKLPKLKLLYTHSWPIEKQLTLEEGLLRSSQDNYLLLSRGTQPAIVMGRSCDEALLIDKEPYLKAPLPIIRRFSGGGTVVVDENTLFFTLILNKEHLGTSAFPQNIMQWVAKLWQEAHPQLGIDLQAQDYTIGKHKFAGNAQSILKDRILHHSSLLWDFQEKYLKLLTLPSRAPAYRQGRSHLDFLCTLKQFLKEKRDWEAPLLKKMAELFTLEEQEPKTLLQSLMDKDYKKAIKRVDLLKAPPV